MSSYYDIRKDETIIIEDGCAIVYDNEGYARTILQVEDGDVERMIEMLEESKNYESFYNEPLDE
jgi:hypothetical protein